MKRCFRPGDILLPDFGKVDAEKWAVIACDQFTSEPAYWDEVADFVGDAPSTLHMILPEVALSESKERIPHIHATIRNYREELLLSHPDSMIYVERTDSVGKSRCGLVLEIDLEAYDFTPGTDAAIRATEATVTERIPPRVAIRRGAELELPHVMLLIDDPHGTVLSPLANGKGQIAYDTSLCAGGGHIRGRYLTAAEIGKVSEALDALDAASDSPLFLVGDGNHSLASAKAYYEEIKEMYGEEAAEHPARYALVEVVNIHDAGLDFEPIYRVLFHVEPEDVLRSLNGYQKNLCGKATPQSIRYHTANGAGELTIASPVKGLTVATLQDFLDEYLREHPNAEIDYIHGEEATVSLGMQEGAIAFLFDGMQKSDLFPSVARDGALPRKTFSMGHARDKRYYMECRAITPRIQKESRMKTRVFGTLPSGKEILEYTLSSDVAEVGIIPLGGTITRFVAYGHDIVLGWPTLEDYFEDDSHQGALIGRYGNRIAQARFTLNGKEYQLAKNNGNNHLHGGTIGFDRRIWEVSAVSKNEITLTLSSYDGEENYPGNLDVTVVYRLDGGALTIDYTACCDADTVCNLTNHSYFNLNGCGNGIVKEHTVTIHAEHYTAVNDELIPTGERPAVEGTPFDFRTPHTIGERLSPAFPGYDHNYILSVNDKDERGVGTAAIVEGEEITMTVLTDQPCMQFYTAGFLTGGRPRLKGGARKQPFAGFCMETQLEPDSPNHGGAILRRGETYRHTTVYAVTKK